MEPHSRNVCGATLARLPVDSFFERNRTVCAARDTRERTSLNSPHGLATCPRPAAGVTCMRKEGGQTRPLLLDGGAIILRGHAFPLLRLEIW